MNSGTETSGGTGKPNHLIIDTGCIDHIVTQNSVHIRSQIHQSHSGPTINIFFAVRIPHHPTPITT